MIVLCPSADVQVSDRQGLRGSGGFLVHMRRGAVNVAFGGGYTSGVALFHSPVRIEAEVSSVGQFTQ